VYIPFKFNFALEENWFNYSPLLAPFHDPVFESLTGTVCTILRFFNSIIFSIFKLLGYNIVFWGLFLLVLLDLQGEDAVIFQNMRNITA
jgi:hypothetical protein